MVNLILGIIGSSIGILVSLLVMFAGGFAEAMGVVEGSIVTGFGWAALLCSAVGLVGAILVKNRPLAGGILMLLTGLTGFLLIGWLYLLSGPLLIIPGILALASTRK